jgi:hypothetical protein
MITVTVMLVFLKKVFSSVSTFTKEVLAVIGMRKREAIVLLGLVVLALVIAFSYCDRKKSVDIRDTRETITIIQNDKDARIEKQMQSVDARRAEDDKRLREMEKRPSPNRDVTAKELEEKARDKK